MKKTVLFILYYYKIVLPTNLSILGDTNTCLISNSEYVNQISLTNLNGHMMVYNFKNYSMSRRYTVYNLRNYLEILLSSMPNAKY